MKAKLVNQLSKKYIIPDLPGYTVKGDLIYHAEIEYLLRGFSFESSAFSKNRFTIYTFIQPLFVPRNYLVFNFGKRLGILSRGHDIWWEYDQSKEIELSSEILNFMKIYGIKFLEKGKSIQIFIKEFNSPQYQKNIHMVEEIGYAYTIVEKYLESKELLNGLHSVLINEINKNANITWIIDMDNRVATILNFLNNGEYKKAKQQLFDWREYTLSTLKLSGNSTEI